MTVILRQLSTLILAAQLWPLFNKWEERKVERKKMAEEDEDGEEKGKIEGLESH